MEFALYDQGEGYYSTHAQSIPDYVTAVNFGPYLGWAVARELAHLWMNLPSYIAPKVFTVVEVGCGSQAAIANGCLEIFQRDYPDLFAKTQVILVDRSIQRLHLATQKLTRLFPGKVFSCPDINQIPIIWGAIVSNELFDAMPVTVIRRSEGERLEQAFVEGTATQKQLIWRSSEDPVLLSHSLELPVGVAYALNLDALKTLETMSAKLEHGFALSIDYGDTRPQVFNRSPVKAYSQGLLKYPDWNNPGKEDITSPVDFSLLMDWGSRLGLEVVGYDSLSSFLIRNGALDMLSEPKDKTSIENNLRVKSLIHPIGFGEDFKVLLQGK